jgi:hypothetical protein
MDNLKEVTADEFYSFIGNKDIKLESLRNKTIWIERPFNRVVGYRYPGWACEDENGKYQPKSTYFIVKNPTSIF